ncbi:MAG: hypothetical protein H0U76_07290 [Ktedonobacteraceae bacterium]|nr:hypothetical protein [Ktedonobacteraceae bacterium]
MNSAIERIALYTTIYRGVESFLPDWYRSVRAQSDHGYQLWIGLDGIDPETAERMIGTKVDATWILSKPNDSPAQIRQRALARITDICEAVVLVDSDDILHGSRVAAARAFLNVSELSGCALRLVDQKGYDLRQTFDLPPGANPEKVLPRHNVFGLSNSAYRSDLLRRCLPIPAEVVLVDWFLATRAWLMGAKLAFDPVIRMDYRQHGTNMARVRGPFTEQQVIQDTGMVRQHFRTFREGSTKSYLPERFAELVRTADDVDLFYQRVTLDSARLTHYVAAFNALALPPLWWSCVAHPSLNKFWQQQ